jgi:hypothetical protein
MNSIRRSSVFAFTRVGARLTSVGAALHTGTAADFAASIEQQRAKIAAIIQSGHGPNRAQ